MTTDFQDPLLSDPPGTVDERIPEEERAQLPVMTPDDPSTNPLCPRGCLGIVRRASAEAEDGSRRYECNNCDYKARRNWSYRNV